MFKIKISTGEREKLEYGPSADLTAQAAQKRTDSDGEKSVHSPRRGGFVR